MTVLVTITINYTSSELNCFNHLTRIQTSLFHPLQCVRNKDISINFLMNEVGVSVMSFFASSHSCYIFRLQVFLVSTEFVFFPLVFTSVADAMTRTDTIRITLDCFLALFGKSLVFFGFSASIPLSIFC